MTNSITLQSWDKASRACDLDPNSGEIRWKRGATTPGKSGQGFVKRCFFGPSIAVYEISGEWFLQLRDEKWNLDRGDIVVETKRIGPLVFLRLTINGIERRFAYPQFVNYLIERFDPTHDGLDSECLDFARWLEEKLPKRRS